MADGRVALALGVVLLVGCGVCKPKEPQVIIRDSVRVEYRERIVHDTAKVEIPVIKEVNVTKDTASHLENAYALSDAVISEGLLRHSLETKPQTILAPVTVHVTDTLVVEKEAEIRTQTEYVEKELNWWQRFRLGAFWWLLGLALVGWRREIIALVKKIIKLFTR